MSLSLSMKVTDCLCLILIASFFLTIQTLSIRETHLSFLNQHNLHQGLKSIVHNLATKQRSSQIPASVFEQLKKSVVNDTDIINSINAQKPLSKESALKVKNFFLENQQFQDYTIRNLVSRSRDPNCLKDMKQAQKKKFLKIILDQLDFSNIFLSDIPEQQFTREQISKIIKQLKEDKQINSYLQKCFDKTRKV